MRYLLSTLVERTTAVSSERMTSISLRRFIEALPVILVVGILKSRPSSLDIRVCFQHVCRLEEPDTDDPHISLVFADVVNAHLPRLFALDKIIMNHTNANSPLKPDL